MKKIILLGVLLVAATASVAEARSRTSLHIGLGFPLYFPYYSPPPVVYYSPPPAVRYVPVPRERVVVDRYRDADCRVVEQKTYDADGFLIDKETRRDCRDRDDFDRY